MKRYFPMWQVTLPLCSVLMFAIGALTAIYLIDGRYTFDLHFSPRQIRIKTDIDKRENDQIDEKAQRKTTKEMENLSPITK